MTPPTFEPFKTAEEFFEETGFGKWLEHETFKQRISNCLGKAGFRRVKLEYIPTHNLMVVKGRSVENPDFRPLRRVRAELLRAFKQEGLNVTALMNSVYRSGNSLLAHVGVLEAKK